MYPLHTKSLVKKMSKSTFIYISPSVIGNNLGHGRVQNGLPACCVAMRGNRASPLNRL